MYKPDTNGNYHTDIVIDIFCGSGGFTAGDTGYKNVVWLKANPYLYNSSLMAESL